MFTRSFNKLQERLERKGRRRSLDILNNKIFKRPIGNLNPALEHPAGFNSLLSLTGLDEIKDLYNCSQWTDDEMNTCSLENCIRRASGTYH